jgi:dethiobiotin synthetase
MKRLVITGIGTGTGKTLVSSIFVQALDGDYWKPIQAGSLEATDSDRVRSLVTAPQASELLTRCGAFEGCGKRMSQNWRAERLKQS